MGSYNDFRNRAAALRRLAETARGEAIRADLTHLADRFEDLAGTLESEERSSEARNAKDLPRVTGP